jgi:glycosyltransferase involved in cell wall biosynthesis
MLKGVSVIVCCYNSRERLPATLQHLLNQQVPFEFAWEIIVVDNASSDQTREIALSFKSLFEEKCAFSVVSEAVPGLTNARKTGINQARFDHILFCDDDNWLCERYMWECFSAIQKDPQIGACGGRGIPVFETEEPVWFNDFQRPFAVGKAAARTGFLEQKSGFITGAGMFLNRKAWNNLIEAGFESILSDRKGNDLSSGGDLEICFALRLAGYQIYYLDEVYFEHYIPKERLSIRYLTRLHEGIGKSNVLLSTYEYVINKMDTNKPFLWLRLLMLLLPQTARVIFSNKQALKARMEGVALKAYFTELSKQRNQFDKRVQKINLLNQKLSNKTISVN